MIITEIVKPKDVKVKVQYHDELNPAIWNKDKLKPEVKKHLIDIADLFVEFMKVPKIKIVDYVLTGSSANFNWTSMSDVDLHVLVNISTLKRTDPELIEEYLQAKKKIWNDLHDIMIYGHEVELYAQDEKEKHIATGMFSVKDNKWIKEPTHKQPDINDTAVKKKTAYMMNKIDNVRNMNASSVPEMKAVKEKIKKMRQSGLEDAGEFSTENLTFKILRDQKYLDKLDTAYHKAIDHSLSLPKK